MEADIEKKIEYEIKCGEMFQQMLTAKPAGPGGDTWDTTVVHQLSSFKVTREDCTEDTVPFVDFMKYEEPTLICGCSIRGREGINISKSRKQCSCWKRNTGGKRDSYIRKMLNTIRTPQIFKNKEGAWRKQISSEPITRKAILAMNETLDMHLEKQLAQEQGVCPLRRHLFTSLFDEMIRQEIIISPERGNLLMRVKDELKMSLMAYEALYEQGLNYGMQKRLVAERIINELKGECDAFLNQTIQLKNKIKALHEEFKDQKMQADLSVKAVRNRAKMEIEQQTQIKHALQLQLNYVIPDIERIEKERRLRNLH